MARASRAGHFHATMVGVKLFRDRAIVLKNYPLAEADMIIVFLSASRGLNRAVAKGLRRPSSKFGGRLELFNCVDLQLYEGKNLDTITETATISPYARTLGNNLAAYTAASAIAQITMHVVEEGESETGEIFSLLNLAFDSLSRFLLPPSFVLDSYTLRALSLCGWQLSLYHCAGCGEKDSHYPGFSSVHGGVLCQQCASHVKGEAGFSFLEEGAYRYICAMAGTQWEGVQKIPVHSRERGHSVIRSFLSWVSEYSYPTISFAEAQW